MVIEVDSNVRDVNNNVLGVKGIPWEFVLNALPVRHVHLSLDFAVLILKNVGDWFDGILCSIFVCVKFIQSEYPTEKWVIYHRNGIEEPSIIFSAHPFISDLNPINTI